MNAIELSEDQELALEKVVSWYRGVGAMTPEFCDGCGTGSGKHTHGFAHDYPVMSLGGLAGTGKTTVTGMVTEKLGAHVAYCTPTHKAASVLRRKLLGESVTTYHSLIYVPMAFHYCARSGVDVHPLGGELLDAGAAAWKACGAHQGVECVVRERLTFERREMLSGHHHLIVVDEASMLSTAQVEDVRSFGVPVLLVGDHGQLPPVRAELNEWIREPLAKLEVNHRQGEGSGIVELAHQVRTGTRVTAGMGISGEIGVLSRVHHPDAVLGLLKRFHCDAQHIIITWRNTTRTGINHAMRTARGLSGEVKVSDRVICLRGVHAKVEGQHATTYVHNGEMGTVVEAGRVTQRGNVTELVVALDGEDRPSVRVAAATHQLGEPVELAHNDPKRPHGGEWSSWDFGYAITAHKAQGSEFDDVIVIDEGPYEYDRWMYTAITRAAKRLVVVKW